MLHNIAAGARLVMTQGANLTAETKTNNPMQSYWVARGEWKHNAKDASRTPQGPEKCHQITSNARPSL